MHGGFSRWAFGMAPLKLSSFAFAALQTVIAAAGHLVGHADLEGIAFGRSLS